MSVSDYIEKLQSLGIHCLYHVTDKDNVASIVKERSLFSWKIAQETGISVTRPGGDPVLHRLDGRLGRDGYVHLFSMAPSEKQLAQFSAQGRFGELVTLEVSLSALRPEETIFWVGDPYLGGRRVDDINVLEDMIRENPSLLNSITVDVMDSIHCHYLGNIPKDIESRISEAHPTAIVFLIDQSRSMSKGVEIANLEYDYISDLAASVVNTLIEHFLKRCVDDDGVVNHLYDIAVLGYGNYVENAWNGDLSDGAFHSPMELLAHVQGDKDSYRWVDPRDDGNEGRSSLGMERVYQLLSEWVGKKENRYSYPPTVIHISDGQIVREYQLDFLKIAERIKMLGTETGNVVLWNVGFSPYRSKEYALLSGEDLPILFHHGTDSSLLYEASSYVPEQFKERAAAVHGGDVSIQRRTMAVNLSVEKLIKLLQMCVLPG